MNRIVLIGNGFDLAHGLKTSYKNFIDWYWSDWGEKLLRGQNKTETDGLCSFKLKENINLANWLMYGDSTTRGKIPSSLGIQMT
ncbi:MAG: AbiH family protein [Bacteroidaceae bacterium]